MHEKCKNVIKFPFDGHNRFEIPHLSHYVLRDCPYTITPQLHGRLSSPTQSLALGPLNCFRNSTQSTTNLMSSWWMSSQYHYAYHSGGFSFTTGVSSSSKKLHLCSTLNSQAPARTPLLNPLSFVAFTTSHQELYRLTHSPPQHAWLHGIVIRILIQIQ